MANNNQLSEWFRQGLDKGYSLEDLRKKALERYPEKEVNDAVGKIKGKPKPKLGIFLLIAAIIIAIVAGYLFSGKYFVKEKIEICLKETSGRLTEFCNALETGDYSLLIADCMQYNPGYDEGACLDLVYQDIALLTNDNSYCKKIKTDFGKQNCLEMVK